MESYGEYDVVVASGGTSGIAAAIAAVRAGARTILIERLGALGSQMNISGPPGFAYAYLFNPRLEQIIGKSSFSSGAKHVAIKDTISYEGIVYPKDGGSYDIPYRCLVPKAMENLRVGGKAISTDRDSYARFLQETMVTGQAAGVAAAECARRGITPRKLEEDATELQDMLLKQGAILFGTH